MKRLIVVGLCSLLLVGCTSKESSVENEYNSYYNDAKVVSLTTNISISKDSKDYATIKGSIYLIEDPLVMYKDEEKVGRADDSFHFVTQDAHAIYIGENFRYDMVGHFNLLGDSYTIYNEDEEEVATAEFNMFNTEGTILDSSDTVIVEYSSGLFNKDYSVRVYENEVFTDDEALLMCASFYSDRVGDEISK